MVTLYEETPLTLQAAAALLPGNCGKSTNPETVRRWIVNGINGVRLVAKRQGRRYVIEPSAFRRFIAQLTAAQQNADVPAPPRIDNDYQQAMRMLEQHGITA